MSDLLEELQASLGTQYTIERELGGGGMSRVFAAVENTLGRWVVVKVLAPDMMKGMFAFTAASASMRSPPRRNSAAMPVGAMPKGSA